jgi:hypothetical protein
MLLLLHTVAHSCGRIENYKISDNQSSTVFYSTKFERLLRLTINKHFMLIYFIDNHELLLYLRSIYSACAGPSGRAV